MRMLTATNGVAVESGPIAKLAMITFEVQSMRLGFEKDGTSREDAFLVAVFHCAERTIITRPYRVRGALIMILSIALVATIGA